MPHCRVSLLCQYANRKLEMFNERRPCSTHPNHVIRQTDHLVTSTLSHFRKAFSFCLVFKSVAWKINTLICCQLLLFSICCLLTRTMNICLHKDIDTTDAIELYFLIFVISPITHTGHVFSSSVILFVSFGEDNISI